MVTIYQCEKCGQIFPEGGVICKVVYKCPKCGGLLILPIQISPRYWCLCLKRFFQSKKKCPLQVREEMKKIIENLRNLY